ncbi:Uncharacterised protein [Vibrio cholerae]|nr:Uncharacterised protein [Vibrio cholerae]
MPSNKATAVMASTLPGTQESSSTTHDLSIKMPSKAVANITIHFGSCISMPVAKPLKLAVMSNAANI